MYNHKCIDLGLSVFALPVDYNFGLIVFSFIFCFMARALHVYPLSFLLNCRREVPIKRNQQHMLCFSGLRGAIAFALSLSFPGNHRNVFTTFNTFPKTILGNCFHYHDHRRILRVCYGWGHRSRAKVFKNSSTHGIR